jgi:tetratricopeptide (TPR) repeat protein
MAVESFFTRWRNAVRPPARGTPNAALLAQKRRQRRLIHRTVGAILILGAGWYVYSYLASAPDRARAEAALGVKKMGPGTYDEAIGRFDRAIQIWPEYAEAYLNRAVAEHDVSQRGPALADLDKALDLDPSLTRAYNERGQIYLEDGDAQKAIQEFSKSIQVKPTLEGYYQRGEAYEKLGEHWKAIADFNAAVVEFREAPYAYRARAGAKRNIGDREGAQADEEKAQWIETGRPVERDVLLAP